MKIIFIIIFSFFPFSSILGKIIFDNYFSEKTLRIDYCHSGNKENEIYSIDELIEEPIWGGSKINLIDKFNYGKYKFEVYDSLSNILIYSRGYSTLFGEWQTTEQAKNTWKTFSETITFPYPQNAIIVKFYSRDRNNLWNKKFEYIVNPDNYFISKEKRNKCAVFKVHYSGSPFVKLDIVIIPDGYTKDEIDLFKKDCGRFAKYLLDTNPFTNNKDKINIWGVEAISEESGTDLPGENIWKNTIVNTNFYTFNSERYLTTRDNKILHNLAANAPYDQIFILVNTKKYGGCGIYNFYSLASSNNKDSNFLLIHEFGHAFAGLADEYYTSDVSLQDFYPLNLEPWEPNITTLTDFDSKWKDMVDKDIPVPTPEIDKYKNKIGVFEGAGYAEKGIYRPSVNCTMKSVSYNNFCPVCRVAIQKMIDFYSK